MTKKQLMIRLSAYKVLIGAICILVVLGVAYGASAYNSYSEAPKVVVEGDYLEAPAPPTVDSDDEEMFGALTSPDIVSKWIAINKDTEYHIVVPFNSASSTFVSFANPFGTATNTDATVELARLRVTAAASTTASYMYFNCGASSDGFGLPDVDIIDIDQFGAASSSAYFENNLTAALGGTLDAGTVAKITLNQTYPYFVCFSSSTASLFDSTQTFDGKATVLINRTR